MTHRKKILYLTFDFIHPIFSGNGTLSRIQVLGLLERGFDLMVLCPDGNIEEDSDLRKWLAEESLCFFCIPIQTSKDLSPLCDWKGFYSYVCDHLEKIEDFHPDLIISIDWHTCEVATLIRQTLSIPLVSQFFRVFSFFTEYIPISQQYELVRKKELQMVEQSDLIITLSKFDRNWCLDNGAKNVHVLYPPLSDLYIHTLFTELQQNSQLYTSSSKSHLLNLLTICRIVPEKLLNRIPPLLAELHNIGINFSYTLIGEPLDKVCYADFLKNITKFNLLSQVVFLGRVTLEQMVHRLLESQIYLHPSSYEPYGLTIVEAAAAGCTVVVDRYGLIGAKEVLNTLSDKAIVVEINYSDPLSCAKTIQTTLKKGEIKKKVVNNLGIIDKLNSKHYMNILVNIINDFL